MSAACGRAPSSAHHRTARRLRGVPGSQRRAVAVLVAGNEVAMAGRQEAIAFAPQVSGDAVPGDAQFAAIGDGLHVAAHFVAAGLQIAEVVREVNIAVDPGFDDADRATVADIDVAR